MPSIGNGLACARTAGESNEPIRDLRARRGADRRRDDHGAAPRWRRAHAGHGRRRRLSRAAKPQGSLPTLKMPTAKGWAAGQTPVAAAGLKVNAFATGLKHPRWIHVLPNGDVLVAEALTAARAASSPLFDYAMFSTMQRAAAVGDSPNRITLLRDADGDGVAETRETFLDGLNQPFGMALLGDTFYVGNTDGVVAFPYAAGASRITAPGRKLADVQARRALDAQPAAEPGRVEALCRRRLAEQYRRPWHGGRGRPGRHLRARSRQRQEPHLRRRPAQPRGPRLGAADRRLVDGGQRARRPGRRDAARLPDLGQGRRLLRLALLLLGPDGRRPRAAGRGPGRQGDHSRTTRWAATPRPWACAGCPPARSRASRTAW